MALTSESKIFVQELTMEYIKQNNLLKCSSVELSTRINEIAKVSTIIANEVDRKRLDFKFL